MSFGLTDNVRARTHATHAGAGRWRSAFGVSVAIALQLGLPMAANASEQPLGSSAASPDDGAAQHAPEGQSAPEPAAPRDDRALQRPPEGQSVSEPGVIAGDDQAPDAVELGDEDAGGRATRGEVAAAASAPRLTRGSPGDVEAGDPTAPQEHSDDRARAATWQARAASSATAAASGRSSQGNDSDDAQPTDTGDHEHAGLSSQTSAATAQPGSSPATPSASASTRAPAAPGGGATVHVPAHSQRPGDAGDDDAAAAGARADYEDAAAASERAGDEDAAAGDDDAAAAGERAGDEDAGGAGERADYEDAATASERAGDASDEEATPAAPRFEGSVTAPPALRQRAAALPWRAYRDARRSTPGRTSRFASAQRATLSGASTATLATQITTPATTPVTTAHPATTPVTTAHGSVRTRPSKPDKQGHARASARQRTAPTPPPSRRGAETTTTGTVASGSGAGASGASPVTGGLVAWTLATSAVWFVLHERAHRMRSLLWAAPLERPG